MLKDATLCTTTTKLSVICEFFDERKYQITIYCTRVHRVYYETSSEFIMNESFVSKRVSSSRLSFTIKSLNTSTPLFKENLMRWRHRFIFIIFVIKPEHWQPNTAKIYKGWNLLLYMFKIICLYINLHVWTYVCLLRFLPRKKAMYFKIAESSDCNKINVITSCSVPFLSITPPWENFVLRFSTWYA